MHFAVKVVDHLLSWNMHSDHHVRSGSVLLQVHLVLAVSEPPTPRVCSLARDKEEMAEWNAIKHFGLGVSDLMPQLQLTQCVDK